MTPMTIVTVIMHLLIGKVHEIGQVSTFFILNAFCLGYRFLCSVSKGSELRKMGEKLFNTLQTWGYYAIMPARCGKIILR